MARAGSVSSQDHAIVSGVVCKCLSTQHEDCEMLLLYMLAVYMLDDCWLQLRTELGDQAHSDSGACARIRLCTNASHTSAAPSPPCNQSASPSAPSTPQVLGPVRLRNNIPRGGRAPCQFDSLSI